MRVVVVAADDLGMTRGITDSILAASDNGVLGQVSIVANGADFERAAEALRGLPALAVAVHVNLTEGRPLSPAKDVPSLTDATGSLRHSFVSLLSASVFARGRRRDTLAAEIAREIRAQIARVAAALPGRALSVNGHEHVHLIPIVRDEVIAAAKGRVTSFRLIREPFAFVSPGPNLVKHFLLNRLSSAGEKSVKEAAFSSPDAYIGVLPTGAVTLSALEALARKIPPRARTVEILVHPGRARSGEEAFLKRSHLGWHYSPWRSREAELLGDPAVADLLAVLRA